MCPIYTPLNRCLENTWTIPVKLVLICRQGDQAEADETTGLVFLDLDQLQSMDQRKNIYIIFFLYRIIHKARDFRDDCTEYIFSVSLYLW